MERFWKKVNKTDYCWLWTGSLRNGYGAFKMDSSVVDAHRVSYQLSNGEIKPGTMVLHKCNNKKCVNPDHLYQGDWSDNARDSIKAGTHHIPVGLLFKKGHKPKNRKLSDKEAGELKDKISRRSVSLKGLSEELQLPYQLLRDISSNRAYKR